MKLLGHLSRLLVGGMFLYSGFVKGVDPLGSAYKFTDYFIAFGMDSLQALSLPLAFLLALLEFVLGAALVLQLGTRQAAACTLLFLSFFTPFTLVLAFTNPVSDCGCFGDALVLTNWQTFWKNLVLLLAAWVTFGYRKHFQSSLSPGRQTALLLLLGGGSLALSMYSYRHLPLLDFRPYAIGKHLAEGETLFIEHPERGDITEAIANDPGYTFLVVTRDLAQSHPQSQAKLNALARYAQARGDRFLGLTASLPDEVAVFQERHQTPYVYCFADETQLKTAIRSNPGLLLLQNGTVIGKWSANDLPDVEALRDKPLNAYCIAQQQDLQAKYLVSSLILLFFAIYLGFRYNKRIKNK